MHEYIVLNFKEVKTMRLKKNSSEQKLRGAYYTPLQIADAMVGLFASQNISTVLEPSCGDGVFLDSLKNLKTSR